MQGHQIVISKASKTYTFKWLKDLPHVMATLKLDFTPEEIEKAKISPLSPEEVAEMQAQYDREIDNW
ncbi:MAG: hypothetical protein FWK04_26280 [Nostoc sp. GBBB01]|nr:hypothetical protein [Nostoc sp. GBBB01]